MKKINLNQVKVYFYNNREIVTSAVVVAVMAAAAVFGGCVNNPEPTELVVEIVDTGKSAATPPANGNAGPEQTNDLFNLDPGQSMSILSFGTIDPVGTSLSEDFDGDGLTNKSETLGNYWVADYPAIETNIAAPVTMTITVMSTSGTQADEIVSDISSSDLESLRNEGSEKFHQNELAERTIQTGTTTSSESSEFNINVGVAAGPFSLGGGGGESSTDTSTRDTYGNQPFVNNIDRSSTSVSSTSSQNNARKFRNDKQTKTSASTKIEPDAGKIRASLYIKNNSVNMPVNLSNILCSLLFESADGELIPIQSFRLRNSDYSIFSVDIYGNSEFGPYVIELSKLNTNEIEQAIMKGYTPKIYIVDYTMTHVPDSNYKAALSSSFSGNNLRIIEENSKGRTALIKLIGPYIRDLYRVAAFDITPTPADICDPLLISNSSLLSPGISIKKILKRIECSGHKIEFGHYIFNYTNVPNSGQDTYVYTEMVKSVDGISNNFPCHSEMSGFDYNNNPVSACVVNIKDLTDTEVLTMSIWTIFSNGKFFNNKAYTTEPSGNIRYFDVNSTIPMLEGVNSMVWVGDNYDLAYLSMEEITRKKNAYGLNPLETYRAVALNTRWTNLSLGINPFYPNTNSVYIGKVALGEKLEFEISLKDNYYLKPSFGKSINNGSFSFFNQFSYNLTNEYSKLFLPGEAFDLQLNFGSGGNQSDWFNILRTRGSALTDTKQILTDCGGSYDYLARVYKVCVQLPVPVSDANMIFEQLPNAGADQMVDVFLRTTPNNAYRETLWPEIYTNVKKLTGRLYSRFPAGSTFINVLSKAGRVGLNQIEAGNAVRIGDSKYQIASISRIYAGYRINLSSPLLENHTPTEEVLIYADLTEPNLYLTIKNTAFNDWNASLPADTKIPVNRNVATSTNLYCQNGVDSLSSILSPLCQGYNPGYYYGNYVGSGGFSNKWSEPIFVKNQTFLNLNKGINMQAISKDFLLNENTVDNQRFPVSKGSGNTVLTVWINGDGTNDQVWGKLFDLNSGKSIGTEFLLSSITKTKKHNHKITISNGKALVAWSSSPNDYSSNIYGRYVNLANGQLSPATDFEISPNSGTYQLPGSLASFGNSAIAVWSRDQSSLIDHDIYGRFFNLSTSQFSSNRFPISSTNTGFQTFPKVTTCGNIAIVTWQSEENTMDYNIRYRLIDLTSRAPLGTEDILLSTSNNYIQAFPDVVCNNSMALVAWQSNDSGSNADIRGRRIDLTTGLPVETSDFPISTTIQGNQTNPQFEIYSDNVLIYWETEDTSLNKDIRGISFDISTGKFLNSQDFLINTEVTNNQLHPVSSSSNGKVFIAWSSGTGSTDYDIRGRFYNLHTLKFDGDFDFFISTSIANDQEMPAVYLYQKLPVAFWQSNDNTVNYMIRGSLVIPEFGMNNFFSSPLIERNYSVRTRILY